MLFPFNCGTMGANDPRGGAIFDTWGMIDVKLCITIKVDNHVTKFDLCALLFRQLANWPYFSLN